MLSDGRFRSAVPPVRARLRCISYPTVDSAPPSRPSGYGCAASPIRRSIPLRRPARPGTAALHLLSDGRFRLPSQESVDGAAQRAGVDRLHQLGVGVGPLGEEAVGLPVEEQQDRHVGDPPGRALEPQVDASPRCRPCWRSACRGSRGRGCARRRRSRTSWPRVTSRTSWPGAGARGLHQVPDPPGVGGDDDRAHPANASRRQRRHRRWATGLGRGLSPRPAGGRQLPGAR